MSLNNLPADIWIKILEFLPYNGIKRPDGFKQELYNKTFDFWLNKKTNVISSELDSELDNFLLNSFILPKRK
jgi:hypothetical protein